MVLTLKTRKFSLGLSLVNSFEAGPYNGLLSRIGACHTRPQSVGALQIAVQLSSAVAWVACMQ